jgi:molybdenum cofactor biosynthesis protein MoaC
MKKLTHLSASGMLQMVDISSKAVCSRVATASCKVQFAPSIFQLLRDADALTPKGDLQSVSKIAAILAAKQTPTLIPLCHSIPIDDISCSISLNDSDQSVDVSVTIKSDAKTGVEMEALTGAAVAALNVYDMCKALSLDISITQLKVVSKQKTLSGSAAE